MVTQLLSVCPTDLSVQLSYMSVNAGLGGYRAMSAWVCASDFTDTWADSCAQSCRYTQEWSQPVCAHCCNNSNNLLIRVTYRRGVMLYFTFKTECMSSWVCRQCTELLFAAVSCRSLVNSLNVCRSGSAFERVFYDVNASITCCWWGCTRGIEKSLLAWEEGGWREQREPHFSCMAALAITLLLLGQL